MARILIVDDESEACATLSKFLESRGYDTDTAANGVEAIARVRDGRFDIVMTDLRMPGMDGADFVARIRTERPDVPVVVMTGHTTLDGQDEIWTRAGVHSVLSKPLDLRNISNLVRDILES